MKLTRLPLEVEDVGLPAFSQSTSTPVDAAASLEAQRRLVASLLKRKRGDDEVLAAKLRDLEEQIAVLKPLVEVTGGEARLRQQTESAVRDLVGQVEAAHPDHVLNRLPRVVGQFLAPLDPACDTVSGPSEMPEDVRLRVDFIYFLARTLDIKYRPGLNALNPTATSGPFQANSAQRRVVAILVDLLLVRRLPLRVIILKARQLGLTQLLLAWQLWLCLTRPHFRTMVIIDKDDHLRVKRRQLRDWLARLGKDFPYLPTYTPGGGEYMVSLSNGSMLLLESAMSPSPGTSESLDGLHESEKPKWPRGRPAQVESSVRPGLPTAPWTMHLNEGTAQGMEFFYEEWKSAEEGQSGYTAIFLPWHLSEEYDVPGDDVHFKYENNAPELQDYDPDTDVVLTEEQFAQRYQLSTGRIRWRRQQIRQVFRGNRRSFDEEYPTTPSHAFASTGINFFPYRLVRQFRPVDPVHHGCLTDGNGWLDVTHPVIYTMLAPVFRAETGGALRVWELPVVGKDYYGGVDVAEGIQVTGMDGKEDPDYTVCIVKDADGRTVAELLNRERPEEAWMSILLLALYYNSAWLMGEYNGPGITLVAQLLLTGYPRLGIDPRTQTSRPFRDRVWCRITKSNRRPLLEEYRLSLERCPAGVRSERLVKELSRFINNANSGRPEAGPGAHDDIIMGESQADYIRRLVREDARQVVMPPEPLPEVRTDDRTRIEDCIELPWASGHLVAREEW